MKIRRNPDLILRNVAGQTVLIPTGEMAQKFNGMINLNSTAAFIWEHMEQTSTPGELAQLLMDTYEVDMETACRDVQGFVATAIHVGYVMMEEE